MTAVTAIPRGMCKCGGDLVVHPSDDTSWTVTCSSCGFEGAAHRSKFSGPERRAHRIERAEFPPEFHDRPFEETAANKSVLFRARAWVRDYVEWQKECERLARHERPRPPKAPGLYGLPGRGKSHLLVETCTFLIDECDATVLFRSTQTLLRELQQFNVPQQGQRRGRSEADEAWDRVITVDVLALDDLGAQRDTEWRTDQIADLIDVRYERQLPILLATNFPPGMWEGDLVDLRGASRLAAMVIPEEIRGVDRRQLDIGQLEGGQA